VDIIKTEFTNMKKIVLILLSLVSLSLYSQRVIYGENKTVFYNGEFVYSPAAAAAAPTNMISNGTFDSGTGWGSSGGYSISGNVANYTCCTASNLAQNSTVMVDSLQTSTAYILEFDVSSNSPYIWMRFYAYRGANKEQLIAGTNYTSGHKTLSFTTPATLTGWGINLYTYGDASGTMDNIELYLDE